MNPEYNYDSEKIIPYEGFYFGNHHSSEFNIKRVSTSDRYTQYAFSNFELQKNTDSYMGSIIYGKKKTNYKFDVSFAFDNLSEKNYYDLQNWLKSDEEQLLIFDEDWIPSQNFENGYRYYCYKTKLATPLKINYLTFDENSDKIYKGEGNVSFISYDNIKYVYDYINGEWKMIDSLTEVSV